MAIPVHVWEKLLFLFNYFHQSWFILQHLLPILIVLASRHLSSAVIQWMIIQTIDTLPQWHLSWATCIGISGIFYSRTMERFTLISIGSPHQKEDIHVNWHSQVSNTRCSSAILHFSRNARSTNLTYGTINSLLAKSRKLIVLSNAMITPLALSRVCTGIFINAYTKALRCLRDSTLI